MSLVNRVQRRGRRAQAGFTLIELLVVIAILGVLAGIVVFNVAGVTNRGSNAACRTDVSTIQAAADAYRNNLTTDTPPGSATNPGSPGSPPASVSVLVTAGYLHSTPSACAAGTYSIDGTTGNVTAKDTNNNKVP